MIEKINEEIKKLTQRFKNVKNELVETQQEVEEIKSKTNSGMSQIVQRNFNALSEGLKITRSGIEENKKYNVRLETTLQQLQDEIQQLKQELALVKASVYGSGATV